MDASRSTTNSGSSRSAHRARSSSSGSVAPPAGSATAGTTAVVWVSQPPSCSSSGRREHSRSVPSMCTICSSRAEATDTGTRSDTSVSTCPPAAAKNVLSSTAAGTISVPCTGWSPG
jgi:hypothetical protein